MDNMQPSNNLYEDIVVIYQKLTKTSNPEKFLSKFYDKIVLQSEKYLGVKNPQSPLITSKIGEKLLNYFKVFQQGGEGSLSSSSEAQQHISMSEMEFHGLQYLAGLMKKVKNDKNYSFVENQNISSILDVSITKDISNQNLIRSVTCGGLSAVNKQCINIFLIAEKHFRNVTKKINLRKITTDEIINSVPR